MLMHAFFMSLAFGCLTPIGTVTISACRQMFGLSPRSFSMFVPHVVHGSLQTVALICSILGFLQAYYAHGGGCATPLPNGGGRHFQSMHSWLGILVLGLYWLQGPTSLALLYSKRVLRVGSYLRSELRRYHLFLGAFAGLAGLVSIISGILAASAKLATNDPVPEFWWPMARTGAVCIALCLVSALALFEAKVPPMKRLPRYSDAPAGTVQLLGPLLASGDDKPSVSLVELSKHRTARDCWVAIHGDVYDVTDWLPAHPGGPQLLLRYAGAIADQGFDQSHEPSVLAHSLPPHALKGRLLEAGEGSSPLPSLPRQPPPANAGGGIDVEIGGSSSAGLKTFLRRQRQPLVLGARFELSHDAVRLRFILPADARVLGLPVGQHLKVYAPASGLVRAPRVPSEWNGRADPEAEYAEIERKYTPVTSDEELGYVDLAIKVYRGGENPRFADGGKLSQYLDALAIGAQVQVSGPWGHLEYIAPGTFVCEDGARRKCRAIGMLAGGTGITPMLQIISAVLRNPEDTTVLSLLYANQTDGDILERATLERLAAENPSRLKLWYTLDRPPESGWAYSTGFITAEMIQAQLPPPGEQTLVLMCGPPPMVKFACMQNLDALGYPKERQLSF